MAGTTGLEPATSDVTGRRSNQLNYVPALVGTISIVARGSLPARSIVRPYDRRMSHDPATPFDSLESSHEYVSLLAEAIEATIAEVKADIALATAEGATRRVEALQLVHFKLTRLAANMSGSRLILNDLRTLRRLLLDERTLPRAFRQTAG
jgi:hypothetical protein